MQGRAGKVGKEEGGTGGDRRRAFLTLFRVIYWAAFPFLPAFSFLPMVLLYDILVQNGIYYLG